MLGLFYLIFVLFYVLVGAKFFVFIYLESTVFVLSFSWSQMFLFYVLVVAKQFCFVLVGAKYLCCFSWVQTFLCCFVGAKCLFYVLVGAKCFWVLVKNKYFFIPYYYREHDYNNWYHMIIKLVSHDHKIGIT